jgi:hypothetical protein
MLGFVQEPSLTKTDSLDGVKPSFDWPSGDFALALVSVWGLMGRDGFSETTFGQARLRGNVPNWLDAGGHLFGITFAWPARRRVGLE